jgi:hypothetical protein
MGARAIGGAGGAREAALSVSLASYSEVSVRGRKLGRKLSLRLSTFRSDDRRDMIATTIKSVNRACSQAASGWRVRASCSAALSRQYVY